MHKSAFTALELVIVIAILAIVGAIALARYGNFSVDARINAAASDFSRMDTAFRLYYAEYGAWPADKGLGVYPPEMGEYLDRETFERGSVLGDAWDWNPTWGPLQPSISLEQNPPDLQLWAEFDRRFDDGDLSTGSVRSSHGRFLHYAVRP